MVIFKLLTFSYKMPRSGIFLYICTLFLTFFPFGKLFPCEFNYFVFTGKFTLLCLSMSYFCMTFSLNFMHLHHYFFKVVL